MERQLFPSVQCALIINFFSEENLISKFKISKYFDFVYILQLWACFVFLVRVVLIILDIVSGVKALSASSDDFTSAEVAFARRPLK